MWSLDRRWIDTKKSCWVKRRRALLARTTAQNSVGISTNKVSRHEFSSKKLNKARNNDKFYTIPCNRCRDKSIDIPKLRAAGLTLLRGAEINEGW